MPNEIGMRRNELPEWSIDLVEINVGNESVDGGVDASRLRPMHVTIRRNKIRQHLQIRKSARVGSRRSVAADALVYRVYATTRKSSGEMIRKLSVIRSRKRSHFLGTVRLRKRRIADLNWAKVS